VYLLTDTLPLHWDAHWAALDVSSALGSLHLSTPKVQVGINVEMRVLQLRFLR